MYTDNTRDALKSQLANAIYHFQQIVQELNRLERERTQELLKPPTVQIGRTFD